MTKSEIITAIIAIYGAVLSTIIANFGRDRVKVKINIRKNQQIIGDPRYRGQMLINVTIINVGRRPVTIINFGAQRLYPHTHLAGLQSSPQLLCEITEAKYVDSYWPQEDFDFSLIDYWYATDSHGSTYKLQEASMFF